MKRTVRIYKPDVCNGDVAGEWEYELYDLMMIPQFLRFIAEEVLGAYLHYHWEIAITGPNHERITLGYIACNPQRDRPRLTGPGQVVQFLNQQFQRDDLIICCTPADTTLEDLNVTLAACVKLETDEAERIAEKYYPAEKTPEKPRTLHISCGGWGCGMGRVTFFIDDKPVCRLKKMEAMDVEISRAGHRAQVKMGPVTLLRSVILPGREDWDLRPERTGGRAGRFALHKSQPVRSREEILSLLREKRREEMEKLTSTEALLSAIREEGLDRKVDFRINENHAGENSVRLIRQADGRYRLYTMGERGVDWQETYEDEREAYYNALMTVRLMESRTKGEKR